MVGWHHRPNGHEFEQAPGVGDGQGTLVCCSPWGHKESDTTEQLNNNSTVYFPKNTLFKKMKTQSLNIHICCCSSVAQSCPTLCDPMDCSTPGFPVLHCLPELAQTPVHRVGDAIQPAHPRSPLLLLPSVLPSIRVFSNESALHSKYSYTFF